MEEIRRADQKLFIRELIAPLRIGGYLLCLWWLYEIFFGSLAGVSMMGRPTLPISAAVLIIGGAYQASIPKRFKNARFRELWEGCRDRENRFREVLSKMRKDKVADLTDLPKNVSQVKESLYVALRRADLITSEVEATEREMVGKPPVWQASTQDAQSRELYKIADKNIAEYRSQLGGVMAGIHRTEAQSAVFMTTLDSLRMKIISYRLVGRSPEMHSAEFLSSLTEAKMQLRSIDQALEELELTPFPKMIAAMPPIPQPQVEELHHDA